MLNDLMSLVLVMSWNDGCRTDVLSVV